MNAKEIVDLTMTQYISKDALVAEIKERIETYNKGYANGDDRRADALEVLLHDINTIEVKEVDLEKEIEENYREDTSTLKTKNQYAKIAKHFFELGLKAYIMTQEEKAKAYDEAFKRAKDCHTDGLSLHQPVRDVIEHIFPELKESENERIRKELICFLETEIPQCNARDKYIDWLEKLGEKNDK